jgi:hypothetical protein
MHWIKTIAAEMLSLFVDDVRFAVAIVAWVVLVRVLAPLFPGQAIAEGPVLFVGLALILVESAARRARN